MKKTTLCSFAAFIAGIAGTALFSYSFPPWKVILYGVSAVVMAAAVGAFGYFYAKLSGGKPIKRAIISFAASLAAMFGVTFLINNVILKATKSTLAAEIITGVLCVMFSLCFIISMIKGGKRPFPAVLAFVLAALIGYAPLIPNGIKDYLKNNPVPVAAPVGFSEFTEKENEKIMDADFYVSPNGNDGGDGSLENPFLTIEKARDEVRKLDKTGKSSITVAVMAGEYRVNSVEFTAEDSGTEACPVIYRAYGDGEAVINGGITIPAGSFKSVSDEKALSRLNPDAVKNIKCVSLKDFGLSSKDWGKIYAIGSYNTAAKYDGDYTGGLYCELFINDERQTLARYPDNDYLYTEKVIKTGLGRESDGAATAVENWDEIRNPESDVYGISAGLAKRIASWQSLDDVWMFGFWKYDWADASSLIGEFDAENKTLSPKFVSTYGTKVDAPYYFFNVFEELDCPGEWYLDRENGILYTYPKCELSKAAVDLSLSEAPIISVKNAQYITFDGLTVKGTRGDGIVSDGNNITVQNCLIKNVAGNALYMNGSNNLAYANEITRTGKGGISLSGGDRETLTPGNNKADNNFIHDWSEIYQTYQPAVTLNGVGNICSHNEMYNSPHEAITYGGNNHIIEYNLIHDVCLLTDDGGAIYSGRRWDWYGNIIRYNAIYNLGADGHRPDGIYMDDALSGQTIYGNLLVNVPKIGIHLGGGRDMKVNNNIIINTPDKSISYDDRAREGVFGGWFTHSSQKGGDMWTNLFESPWQSGAWKAAFPEMQKFSDDFDNTDAPEFVPNPAFSDVSGNIIVNTLADIGNISDSANKYSSITGNVIFKLSKADNIFTSPENGDYSIKEGSAVYDTIPGFENIPVNEIGRY